MQHNQTGGRSDHKSGKILHAMKENIVRVRVHTSLWTHVWMVSNLKSHSLCQISKAALSQSVSDQGWYRAKNPEHLPFYLEVIICLTLIFQIWLFGIFTSKSRVTTKYKYSKYKYYKYKCKYKWKGVAAREIIIWGSHGQTESYTWSYISQVGSRRRYKYKCEYKCKYKY